jgi:hypothetical protein
MRAMRQTDTQVRPWAAAVGLAASKPTEGIGPRPFYLAVDHATGNTSATGQFCTHLSDTRVPSG